MYWYRRFMERSVMKGTRSKQADWVLTHIVEPRRRSARISLRTAAERAGISEANWRQLAAGGVNVGGQWVNRRVRRDQVLRMAHAVGCIEEAAAAIEATEDEVAEAERHVVVLDPAEEELMNSRNLSPIEKLRLIEQLQALRKEG
jgi:hypothetical protein